MQKLMMRYETCEECMEFEIKSYNELSGNCKILKKKCYTDTSACIKFKEWEETASNARDAYGGYREDE